MELFSSLTHIGTKWSRLHMSWKQHSVVSSISLPPESLFFFDTAHTFINKQY